MAAGGMKADPAAKPTPPDAVAQSLAASGDVRSDDAVLAQAHGCFAEGALSDGIRVLVERAASLAGRQLFVRALPIFDLARASLTARIDANKLAATVSNTHAKLKSECRAFAKSVAENSPEDGKNVFVYADSLGLPRPEEAAHGDGGIGLTYAAKIQARSGECGARVPLRVEAECQRYFTTDDVTRRLTEMRGSLRSGFILVHVGLNDCASRIFSEAERLAVGFLDPAVQKLLLDFARDQRRPIIHRNPEYSYVPLERFTENLEKIVKISRSHGAQHVTFVNIVQPGLRSETHTPHLRWNFTRYNLSIYDVAKRLSAHVIDADRLCWSAGLDRALNADGIHLSAAGHDIVADRYLELIAPALLSKP